MRALAGSGNEAAAGASPARGWLQLSTGWVRGVGAVARAPHSWAYYLLKVLNSARTATSTTEVRAYALHPPSRAHSDSAWLARSQVDRAGRSPHGMFLRGGKRWRWCLMAGLLHAPHLWSPAPSLSVPLLANLMGKRLSVCLHARGARCHRDRSRTRAGTQGPDASQPLANELARPFTRRWPRPTE